MSLVQIQPREAGAKRIKSCLIGNKNNFQNTFKNLRFRIFAGRRGLKTTVEHTNQAVQLKKIISFAAQLGLPI
jgi:hypothetical protein